MTNLHAAAIAFFATALLFYGLSWLPGAIGFALFGVLFELAAWIVVFFTRLGSSRAHGAENVGVANTDDVSTTVTSEPTNKAP